MESREIAIKEDGPISLADMQVMAQAMAKSRLFPSCQTPENALALMLLCQSEGIHPAQAVRRFHVINGTCSMRADAMLAEFQRQGGKVQWISYDAKEASAKFSHPSGGEITFSFTFAEAQKGGLVRDGGNWAKFPAAMLRARCISGGIRMVLPGVVCGVYTPEEVEDFGEDRKGKPETKKKTEEKSLADKIGLSQEKPTDAEIIKEAPPANAKDPAHTNTLPESPKPPTVDPIEKKPETPKTEKPPVAPPANFANGKEFADAIQKMRKAAIDTGIRDRAAIFAHVSAACQREVKDWPEVNMVDVAAVVARFEEVAKEANEHGY